MDYTRKGVTPIFIMPEFSDLPEGFDSPEKAFRAAVDELELPEKVDDNLIEDCIMVEEGLSSSMQFELGKGFKDDHVREVLRDMEVTRKVIDSIFDADEKGRYSMEELIERVKYDMTDAEVEQLKATVKGFDQGARDVQWINKILNSNYIFVFRFKYIKSYETIREESGNTNVRMEEGEKGYAAKGHAFIYRIDMNDTVRHRFFNNAWAGRKSSEKKLQNALSARKEMEFPLEYLDQCTFGNEEKQGLKNAFEEDSLSKKDKFLNIAQNSLNNGKECFEKKVDLTGDSKKFDQVSSSVFDTDYFPYFYAYSKIGTKEGVEQDDRFYVYETVMKEGEKQQELRGVVRATGDIAENDTIASGDMEPSKFVQTYGKPLGKGMLLRQKNGGFLSLSIGWAFHGRHYFNGQWELRLSKWMDFSNGFYFYQDFGYAFASLSADEDIYQTELGVSQMLYLTRDLHLSPYIGMKLMPNTTYDAGVRLDVNLSHWLKLRSSFGFAPIPYAPDGEEGAKRLLADQELTLPNKWSLMLRAKF